MKLGYNLDANIVYGFILDRYIWVESLPEFFTDKLSVEQVADLIFIETDEVGGSEYIQAVLKTKFPDLDWGYPGTEHNEQMVVYAKSTRQSAYYDAEPFKINEMASAESAHIAEIAGLLGKEAQWLLYPTYG